MSYSFLIDSIGSEKYFQITPDLLAAEIKTHWPLVEVQSNLEAKHTIEWKLSEGTRQALCGFHDNDETISVEGDLSLAAQVAAWYRSLVPKEYELFFYTGARLDRPVKLSFEITPQEIERIFNLG